MQSEKVNWGETDRNGKLVGDDESGVLRARESDISAIDWAEGENHFDIVKSGETILGDDAVGRPGEHFGFRTQGEGSIRASGIGIR